MGRVDRKKIQTAAYFSILGTNHPRFSPQTGGDSLHERLLDDTNRFVLLTESFDDIVKFVYILPSFPGHDHDFSREDTAFNGVAGDGSLSPLRSWTCRAKSVTSIRLDSALGYRPLATRAFDRRSSRRVVG